MSAVIGNPLLLSPEGYQISRSVRLRSSASATFSRTPASTSNTKTWTWSGWIKRGALASGTCYEIFGAAATSATVIYFVNDNFWFQLTDAGGTTIGNISSVAAFRDPSAWYHVVAVLDTTQSTSTNRCKLYINGVQQTLTFSITPSQNADARINNSAFAHSIGGRSTLYFDGYLTEVNFIDGQALTPSSFGEYDTITGVWKPKKYAGTYGTNGFYLNFSDNSAATAAAIGKDYSGNGNNWTPNNISVTAGATYDSMLDVPTMWADGGNGRGNYCTLLPTAAGSYVTMSNGNLTVTGNTATNSAVALSSIAVTTGLFYFENTITTVGGISYIGFARLNSGYSDLNNAESFTNTNNYGGVYRNGGDVFGFGKTISSTSTFTTGDVLGLALDMDNGAAYVSKNGTWLNSGVPTSGASKTGALFTWTAGTQTICPMGGGYNGSVNNFNFGQRPFTYTPPTGFKALNTQNLPEPTIKKGNQYFNAVTYAGNNSSKVITGLGFQPDLLWFKARATAYSHALVDAVRGRSKVLQPNLTSAEATTTSASNDVVSFDADGFTLGPAEISSSINNDSSIVSWAWKESAQAGFDIQAITAQSSGSASFSHSLGAAPAMYIVKPRANVGGWNVYHQSLGATKVLALNGTGAAVTSSTTWNNTAPTSTQFTLGTDYAGFGTQIVYLFSEVAGFSKFGSYTGNGSADEPFVFCGFRPRWVMTKRTDSTGSWLVVDSARNSYNVVNGYLLPNTSDAEGSATWGDFTSNGFKLRGTTHNGSGESYIFAAFAENPFKYSIAR